jgi:aldehyde:ferredoxin oxidoreductase
MYGYAGSILRVDLSSASFRPEPLPDSLVKNFIGGRGFVAKLLFDELAPAIDAFDPQNMLIAATLCRQQYGRAFRTAVEICRL